MKAKKMLALLLSGAMALTMGFMAACDKPGNSGGGDNPGGEVDPPVGGDYTLDTTEYYLAGTGAGDLKQNNWSETNHVLALTRDEKADHNKFDITISMYAGDAFQIVHDDSWTGQMGIDFMYGVEDGEIKDEDGNVVFSGVGMHGTDIQLQPGHDGVYTFSLHTFPDGEETTYITYNKDSELAALVDMYVVGDMNDFGRMEKTKNYHMTKNGSIWKFVLEITEDDVCRDEEGELADDGIYAFAAVRNDVEDASGEKIVTNDSTRLRKFNDEMGYEYNLLEAGVYTFRYDADEDVLTIVDSAYEMYFVGSFNDNTPSEKYALSEGDDGNWYGYIALEEAAQVSLYNKYTETTYNVNEGAQLEAGEYFVKFVVEDKSIEHEALAYYIAGTVEGAEWGVCATSPKLTWDEENGVYTVDLADITSAELKVVHGTLLGGVKTWYGVGADGNDNASIIVAGDYTVTFNPNTKAVTVTEAIVKVTVSFDLNYPDGVQGPEGQVAPASQTINKRQTATAPTEELTLENYTFLGWYLDKNHTEKFEFSTPVTEDITLYAGWILTSEIPATPKITFNLNYTGAPAAEVIETVEGLIGDKMPEEPVRDGYWFLGWYTSAAGTAEFNFSNPVTTDTTVYAKWLQIDTRPWHIVGLANWNSDDHTYMFTHDADYPKQNVLSITLTMSKGNEFKILGVDTWSQPEVNGSHLFGGTGELSGSGNISVGATGTYKLILFTDGGYKLTYTYTAFSSSSEIYFQVNGVKGDKLTLGADGNWTGKIYRRNGATIKLLDTKNGNTEYAVNLPSNGDFNVTFTPSNSSVTFNEIEYYVAGEFSTPGWGEGVPSAAPKFVWNEEAGAYTVDVTAATAGAQFKVVIYENGGVNWNNDFNNSVTAGTYIGRNGDNLTIKTAGTYTLTLDMTTGSLTAAPKAA